MNNTIEIKNTQDSFEMQAFVSLLEAFATDAQIGTDEISLKIRGVLNHPGYRM
jgi:hypothetical protein